MPCCAREVPWFSQLIAALRAAPGAVAGLLSFYGDFEILPWIVFAVWIHGRRAVALWQRGPLYEEDCLVAPFLLG